MDEQFDFPVKTGALKNYFCKKGFQESADDLVQEVMLAYWKKKDEIREGHDKYIWAVARNQLSLSVRRKLNRNEVELPMFSLAMPDTRDWDDFVIAVMDIAVKPLLSQQEVDMFRHLMNNASKDDVCTTMGVDGKRYDNIRQHLIRKLRCAVDQKYRTTYLQKRLHWNGGTRNGTRPRKLSA